MSGALVVMAPNDAHSSPPAAVNASLGCWWTIVIVTIDTSRRLRPEERYRMRRLTPSEMSGLVGLARRGRKGPGVALEALWDLILRDAEGVGVAEAAARIPQFRVQDYAIAADQAQALHDAFLVRRRLSGGILNGIGMLWLDQSPAEYDDCSP